MIFTVAKIVNSVGLVFDIFGALLIWRYGLPELLDASGGDFIVDSPNEEQAAKYRTYKLWSNIGLASLFLGFVLQLASNFIPF